MRRFPIHVKVRRRVIGICNTSSELTPCNEHLGRLAEAVNRRVCECEGWPLEFSAVSMGKSNLRPAPMLYYNPAVSAVEESIRSNLLDGVVLLAGCDKTPPILLIDAASFDLPNCDLDSDSWPAKVGILRESH